MTQPTTEYKTNIINFRNSRMSGNHPKVLNAMGVIGDLNRMHGTGLDIHDFLPGYKKYGYAIVDETYLDEDVFLLAHGLM